MWLVDSSCQLLQKFPAEDDDHCIRTQQATHSAYFWICLTNWTMFQFTKYHESDASKYLRVKVLIRGKQGDRIKVVYPETAVLMDAKAQ